MILPILFSKEHIDIDKLANLSNQADITPRKLPYGIKACVLQNTLSQIHWHGRDFNLSNIPYITIEDVISCNYDIDTYLEITTAQWFVLKDRKWVKGKNIIITNYTEAWVRGLPIAIDNVQEEELVDLTVVSDMLLAKDCVLVRDNATTIPGIRCLPYHSFYTESRDWIDFEGGIGHAWLPWCDNYHQFVEDNIAQLPYKPKTYTALLGWDKRHRNELHAVLTKSNMEGYLGGFGYNAVEHDHPGRIQHDRFIAKEWLWESKVWLSVETHCPTNELPHKSNQMSSITEKTWKPIAMGMPFLIVNNPDCLNSLRELGFNSFIEVFGCYMERNFVDTIDNIVDILENFDSYDTQRIQEICKHNYNRFIELTSDDYRKHFMDKLGIAYA
jgi:hypothetical protein